MKLTLLGFENSKVLDEKHCRLVTLNFDLSSVGCDRLAKNVCERKECPKKVKKSQIVLFFLTNERPCCYKANK